MVQLTPIQQREPAPIPQPEPVHIVQIPAVDIKTVRFEQPPSRKMLTFEQVISNIHETTGCVWIEELRSEMLDLEQAALDAANARDNTQHTRLSPEGLKEVEQKLVTDKQE